MVGDDLLYFERLSETLITTVCNFEAIPAERIGDDRVGYSVPKHDMEMMLTGALAMASFVSEYLGGEVPKPGEDVDLNEWASLACLCTHQEISEFKRQQV